jgi:proteasome accessory factor C
MVTSSERLRRLLALVPYVATRRVVGLAETAATFGMSERDLIDDLNLAWCVELRDPEPYCPIDLSYEDGEISISQAESIDRPLRLAADEASALLIALRVLAEASDDAERDPVNRLIAKIEDAAGAAVAAGVATSQVTVKQFDSKRVRAIAGTLEGALAGGRRVHLRHYNPTRDEDTERDVDPMRLVLVEGRTYLEGWCRRAEGVRLFRLDRVLSVDVLDVAAKVPRKAKSRDLDAGLFQASESDVLAELELGPEARWFAEYHPCESVTELPDGRLRVGLRAPDLAWVRRQVLKLGEDARVVSPPELAAEVAATAAATLALYE